MTDEKRRTESDRRAEAQALLEDSLRAVMATTPGRQVLFWLLQACGLYQQSAPGRYDCTATEVAEALNADLVRVAPSDWVRMRQEALDRDAKELALRSAE